MRLPNRTEIVKSEYIIFAASKIFILLATRGNPQRFNLEQIFKYVLIISNWRSCKYVLQIAKRRGYFPHNDVIAVLDAKC